MLSKILFGMLLTLGLGGYLYYNDTQDTIKTLMAEIATQQNVINAFELRQAEQQKTLEALENNLKVTSEALQTQNARNQEIESEMNRYLSIFARHNLTKLAAAKPGLIETRVNNATKEVFDGIENDSIAVDAIDD